VLILVLGPGVAPAQWVQVGSDIDGEAVHDYSGTSVSLSAAGTRVAIGATGNDGNGGSSGQVRVYGWSDTAWVQLGADIDGEAASDQAGFSVSLSAAGTRVAIGAPYNSDNGTSSGQVRVFDWANPDWAQVGTDIDGEAASDMSGTSVSLSADGTRVAVGSYRNDGNGESSGHVRVYEWGSTDWVQVGADIDGEAAGDNSGASVSLSGDGSRVAIGASGNDDNGSGSGHVRVFDWVDPNWVQVGADIDGEAASDYSGTSVSLSGDGSRVAIGAHFNDGNGLNSGHVRIFEWVDPSWVQLGSDLDGEAAGDQSGLSVSLSGGGSRVAIGAMYNDGNGESSGHVRVFEWGSTDWVQVSSDIDGEAAGDESGRSVSLSAGGLLAAIGAHYNDGTGGYSNGHVRVFVELSIFADGFESGGTSRWSSQVPAP
jgi:hypothetical protein